MLSLQYRTNANYLIISILLIVSLFSTTYSYADNDQDVAALEDFYYQIFNKQALQKPSKKYRNKNHRDKVTASKTQTTLVKHTPSKPNYIGHKDPELVAFYQSVFGENQEVQISNNLNKPIKTPKIQINNRQTVTKGEIFRLKQSKQRNAVTKKLYKKTIQENKKKTVNLPLSRVKHKPTKYTESDTAALFEKAFGKKKQKESKVTSESIQGTHSNDMATLFAKAFGKKAIISTPSKLNVDLRIDGKTQGEVELSSNSSGIIDRVKTQTLIKILDDNLKEHVFIRVKEQIEKNKFTTLKQLNNLELTAFYNATNLSLDFEIKPEHRKPQILSLLNKKKANVREENIVEAHKVSGFINAFTTVGINSRDDDADLRMRLEGSLNIGGAVFETTSDFRNNKFDFGRTTLTYDKPEKLKRYALGNISTGNRNFQENLELDGIRISKEFFLDPNLQITPRANESLQLDSDSEVELYINNQLIRRFYLKAGIYSLQDIGLYNGANNIRIRIKDEFGKVTVKTSQQYYDSHLLKPGLSLFAISVGYLSNQNSNSKSKLEKTPIFSGYYQKGISKDLTISLDLQLNSSNFLVGGETISSIKLGSIKNSIALSGGKERNTGFASSFEFRPNNKHELISLDTLRQDLLGLDTSSRGLLNSWSITGEYRSEDFSVLNGIDPNIAETTQEIDGISFANRVFNSNKLKSNLQTNFSLNFSEKWQGNLNLGMANYYDAKNSYYANLSTTRRFNNGMRISIGSRYDTEDEFSMNLQLSIPLSRDKGKRKMNLDVLADSRDNAYETKLSFKPSSLVGKNSIAGSLEHFSDKSSRQENLDLQYRNSLFETKLTARNRHNKNSGDSTQQLNLGFNTSIACVGSSCASSYPINDSFALVSGPSNQTTPIALNNNNRRFRYSENNDTGLPDNYTALISGKGKKAVVRLESYRTQNINIDEGTLPNGYDSEKTEFSLFPGYHQGFSIKAGGEPATTLDGLLLDDQNNLLSFKGGQWIPENSDKQSKAVAFFSNKSGKFRVTSIPAGKYKLELFDYPDMAPNYITVPDSKGKIHDAGRIIIRTPN